MKTVCPVSTKAFPSLPSSRLKDLLLLPKTKVKCPPASSQLWVGITKTCVAALSLELISVQCTWVIYVYVYIGMFKSLSTMNWTMYNSFSLLCLLRVCSRKFLAYLELYRFNCIGLGGKRDRKLKLDISWVLVQCQASRLADGKWQRQKFSLPDSSIIFCSLCEAWYFRCNWV